MTTMRSPVKLKQIYFVTTFFIIFVGNFATCFAGVTGEPRNVNPTCQTKACIETAAIIKNSMNESVNPCDDFYHYTCGNYIKNAVIPADKSSTSFITDMADKVREKLKYSIENQITENDPETFKKLKAYYNACLNETHIETESRREFLRLVKWMGGWPLIDGVLWNELTFDWISTMNEFHNEGYSTSYFISVGMLTEMTNNSHHVLFVDQPALALPRQYLAQGLKNPLVKSYYKFMLKIAELLGVNPYRAKEELEKSLQFEIELAKIMVPNSKRRTPQSVYNPMTVRQLKKRYPLIPFAKFLNRIIAPKNVLNENDIVVVSSPWYFDNLTSLIARTPKRVQANYAYWQVALDSINQLDSKMIEAGRNFTGQVTGQRAQSPRWQKCVKEVDSALYLATGALYVRRNFDKDTKKGALEMVENLRNAFRSMLTKVNWMDDQTKNAAIDKLNNMIPLVAYPDELLNDTALDTYYKTLQVDSHSYFKTVRKAHVFANSHAYDHYRKPANKSDWTGLWGHATVVNAFYSPAANTINFPSGILQGSFFDKDLPKYVNYARIGTIVGHEMTHGFDNNGRLFDKDGNMKDWWNLKTKDEFLKRADCIVNQYNNYTSEEVHLHVNGRATEGENIADNGGVKEAYLAYTTWLDKTGYEAPLPGLEKFTTKQLFWLSNANQWCTKYRPEYLKNEIMLDVHSPNEYRCIGILSNIKEFSDDFNCPVGSKMNPVNKCAVW